jgi:NADPH-dependent ferric siderophore reductase
MPDDAEWLLLVGDLTALPAVARIMETVSVPVTAWVETPDEPIRAYVDRQKSAQVSWSTPPSGVETATADIVTSIDWPPGSGYFWMAGESAQMRAIRKHLMRERQLPTSAYDVMGYWRGGGQQRQPRAVDPGPIWRAGKAAGKSDDQIWADYDAARDDAGREKTV